MKCNLLGVSCISVLLSATNASAIDVYKKEGLTVKVKGDYQIQLRKKTNKSDNVDLEYDDLELKFHVNQNFGAGVSVFGVIDVDFKREADVSIAGDQTVTTTNGDTVVIPNTDRGARNSLDEAYVGITFNDFTIGLGKADYPTDDFGVEIAYEMDKGDLFDDQNVEGDDAIFGNYRFGESTLYFSTDIEEGSDGKGDESSFDLLFKTQVAGLTLGLAYQNAKANEQADSVSTYGVSLQGKAVGLGYGIAYSSNDDDNAADNQVDLSLKAKLSDSVGAGFGYQTTSFDDSSRDDLNTWYANVSYSFSKQVRVFGELGGNDGDDQDIGYLVGLRFRF